VRQIEIAYLVIIYLKFKPFCEDTGSVAICKLLIDAACVVVGGSKQLGMAHQYFFDEEDANLFCNALVRNELMRFIEGSNWYNEESRDAFLANTRFVFKGTEFIDSSNIPPEYEVCINLDIIFT
jgi:hypothetical protein